MERKGKGEAGSKAVSSPVALYIAVCTARPLNEAVCSAVHLILKYVKLEPKARPAGHQLYLLLYKMQDLKFSQLWS
jgi:hypothetical protein